MVGRGGGGTGVGDSVACATNASAAGESAVARSGGEEHRTFFAAARTGEVVREEKALVASAVVSGVSVFAWDDRGGVHRRSDAARGAVDSGGGSAAVAGGAGEHSAGAEWGIGAGSLSVLARGDSGGGDA